MHVLRLMRRMVRDELDCRRDSAGRVSSRELTKLCFAANLGRQSQADDA